MPETSDISGREIREGSGGTARILYGDPSKESCTYKLTDSEIEQLLAWAKAASPQLVLTPGRRSDKSGKVIRPATGASLEVTYRSDGETHRVDLNLTDDEVSTLSGEQLTRGRLNLAGALAIGGGLIALLLSTLTESGTVAQHPVLILVLVTMATIAIATLFWKNLERISSRVLIIASGLGVLLTTLFAIAPNIAPETAETFKIQKIAIEPGVSLAQYFADPGTRPYLNCGSSCSNSTLIRNFCSEVKSQFAAANDSHCPPVQRESIVALVPLESTGFTHRELPVRWVLFNGSTGERVRRQPVDPLGGVRVIPEKRQLDVLTLPFWVDMSHAKAKRLFIRAYVFDNRGYLLATARSPTFANPQTK